MNSVCVVTGSRAEYHLLAPLLDKLAADPFFDLRLVVTGSHLSEAHGMTVKDIVSDGYDIDEKIPILLEEDGPKAVNGAIARGLVGFDEYFAERRPDLVVVLGDRFELMAVAIAATNRRIPLGHIHGGELTAGAVDDVFRHSVTKMSYLHFASCEPYRRRIVQLGESPDRVYNVGALGVENMLSENLMSAEELGGSIGLDLGCRFMLATFHAETLEEASPRRQIDIVLDALDEFPALPLVFTKSNADEGGIVINKAIESYASRRENCVVVASLGARRYASALKEAAVVVGNSSSGILETPTFGTPTVNIGDRQAGRIRSSNIIDCPLEKEAICASVETALSPEFKRKAEKSASPYGSGHASERIVAHLKEFFQQNAPSLKKAFYDIPLPTEL